jgi:hypothetical protein
MLLLTHFVCHLSFSFRHLSFSSSGRGQESASRVPHQDGGSAGHVGHCLWSLLSVRLITIVILLRRSLHYVPLYSINALSVKSCFCISCPSLRVYPLIPTSPPLIPTHALTQNRTVTQPRALSAIASTAAGRSRRTTSTRSFARVRNRRVRDEKWLGCDELVGGNQVSFPNTLRDGFCNCRPYCTAHSKYICSSSAYFFWVSRKNCGNPSPLTFATFECSRSDHCFVR